MRKRNLLLKTLLDIKAFGRFRGLEIRYVLHQLHIGGRLSLVLHVAIFKNFGVLMDYGRHEFLLMLIL